jgi:ribosomal protein S18 acetylase RimI-like enzyme
MSNIVVVDLSEEHIPYLMEISSVELGSDYLKEEDFRNTLTSEDDFCLVAVDGTVPLGFALCNIFGKEKVDSILHMPDGPERDEILGYGRVGYLSSVAVSDSVKKKGIGKSIVAESEREFDRRKVDVSCAMAWKSVDGTVNISKVVEGVGMKEVAEFKGYWNDPRVFPDGHNCPVCGNPCKCSAVYYLKRR